jgi:hypothetical protein
MQVVKLIATQFSARASHFLSARFERIRLNTLLKHCQQSPFICDT